MSALAADDKRASRHGWAWRAWILAIAPAVLLAGGACSNPLQFSTKINAATGTGGIAVNGGDGGPDVPGPGTGGAGGAIDAPIAMPDAPVDQVTDTPRDVLRPDVQPDVPGDVREVGPDVRDTGVDLQRDTGVDAGGPVVCATASDCKLTGLTCLLAAGQPGRCVECVGSADCAASTVGKLCDPNTQRCVECLVAATDCPTTSGTASSEHPSQCSANHLCLNGCSDDMAAELVCPKANLTCITGSMGSGPDICAYCTVSTQCGTGGTCLGNVCITCLNDGNCAATPTTPICDTAISGRCVQCRDSRDCAKTPALPLCDPARLTCVALP